MNKLNDLQQRQLEVHNYGEAIERAIWGAINPEKPYKSPCPFGVCTADACCKNPLPLMYCAFTYLAGKGSDTAEGNLIEFDCLYSTYLGCSLNDLFSDGEEVVKMLITDFHKLCK